MKFKTPNTAPKFSSSIALLIEAGRLATSIKADCVPTHIRTLLIGEMNNYFRQVEDDLARQAEAMKSDFPDSDGEELEWALEDAIAEQKTPEGNRRAINTVAGWLRDEGFIADTSLFEYIADLYFGDGKVDMSWKEWR